jgi:hypothetical protein
MLIKAGFGGLFKDRSTNVINFGANWYEEVGNFGYSISPREIERVALALNYPHVAFRGINDVYIEGVENEPAVDSSPLFSKTRGQIAELDRLCTRGLSRSRNTLLVAVIFKEAIDPALKSALLNSGYDVRDLSRNPYLSQ